MFKVIHIRQKTSDSIYGGRGSALGNPFVMHGESQRDNVCDRYKAYFDNMLKKHKEGKLLTYPEQALYSELVRLYRLGKNTEGDIELFCYCAPKRCHLETVANHLNYYLNQTKDK